MKIESNVKNKVTKTQCNELFDIIVKDKLKNFNFNMITNFSCLPVAFVYDRNSEISTFYIGKHVNEDILKRSSIKPKFFEQVTKDLLMEKGRNGQLTLDVLNEQFNKVILETVSKIIPKDLFFKTFNFKNKVRFDLFKGYYQMGLEYPNRKLSQNDITMYIKKTNPEGYEGLLKRFETPAYINRQLGIIIGDNLKQGMIGSTQLGDGYYMFDFKDVDVKINEKTMSVFMKSELEFTSKTGLFWTQTVNRTGTHARKEKKHISKNHPLTDLFNEHGVDLKYLPANKKDTKGVINYLSRNKPRVISIKIMSAINDWDGKLNK